MIFNRSFTLFPQIFKKGLKRYTEQKNVYFKELTVRKKINQSQVVYTTGFDGTNYTRAKTRFILEA